MTRERRDAEEFRWRQTRMSTRWDFEVSKLVEGFAAMRQRLVCEERLRLEAPGTEPCFPCQCGRMFGASRWPSCSWVMRSAVYAGVRRGDYRFGGG
jgi:hypothetical protein